MATRRIGTRWEESAAAVASALEMLQLLLLLLLPPLMLMAPVDKGGVRAADVSAPADSDPPYRRYCGLLADYKVELCMGMGIPVGMGFPWESHGNGNRSGLWTGMGMGILSREWEWRIFLYVKNSHYWSRQMCRSADV